MNVNSEMHYTIGQVNLRVFESNEIESNFIFYIRKEFLSHKQTFLKKKYENKEDRQNEK